MSDITDIIANLTAQLAYVAPVNFGLAFEQQNVDLPLYEIFPLGETFEQTPNGRSSNPPALYTVAFELEVRCWGADLSGALRLRQAFITAARLAMGGGPNVRLGRGAYVDPRNLDRGAVYVLPVTLLSALPAATLPTSAGVGVVDATIATVKPVNQATQNPLDTSGYTPGTNSIVAGTG